MDRVAPGIFSALGDARYWHFRTGSARHRGVSLFALRASQGCGVSREGRDLIYTAIASRSVCGSIAVFVTTSVMDDPTRPWFGVAPVLSTSAISSCFQSPIRFGVMLGMYPAPSGSCPPAKRVLGLMAPKISRDE